MLTNKQHEKNRKIEKISKKAIAYLSKKYYNKNVKNLQIYFIRRNYFEKQNNNFISR